MSYKYIPMDQRTADHLRAGGPDCYGNAPEQRISDGAGVPCRRCMGFVSKGEPYLIAAWRPFTELHAYAETGPVFIHAHSCTPDDTASQELPAFLSSPDYILRGYDSDERIVYGTGGVITRESIPTRVQELLRQPEVKAVHIRSSRNNCYHCRAVSAD
jgi:hypothetical protein